MPHPPHSPAGRTSSLIRIWAVVGFSALIARAVVAMLPIVADLIQAPQHPGYLAGAAVSVVFFSVGKGYFAFHRGYAPRFAARLRRLQGGPTILTAVLAPVACMGLVPLSKEEIPACMRSVALVALMVVAILASRQLGPSWRGVVIAGVIAGLSIGLFSVVWHCLSGRGSQDASSVAST